MTLREAREMRHLTQIQVVEKMGVSPLKLISLEKCAANLKLKDARRLAEIYQIEVENIEI